MLIKQGIKSRESVTDVKLEAKVSVVFELVEFEMKESLDAKVIWKVESELAPMVMFKLIGIELVVVENVSYDCNKVEALIANVEILVPNVA